MDFEEDNITADQYEKEKARAQQVSQPMGTAYDPANPSADNQAYAVYCCPAPASGITPITVYDPGGSPLPITPPAPVPGVVPYRILMYNGVNNAPGLAAQNRYPTAPTAPYINGLYYPDSAQNIPLSPCRALQRDTGALLHSVLDAMDADYLTFRATGVMQYNNVVLDLTGIESNVEVGAGASPITEMQDILIGSLPSQLFKPIICKIKSTSAINLYQVLNSNPNGYVRFYWPNEGIGFTQYKFFINTAKQQPSANGNIETEFSGWFTPDMVI
jgi:hypothetical protein